MYWFKKVVSIMISVSILVSTSATFASLQNFENTNEISYFTIDNSFVKPTVEDGKLTVSLPNKVENKAEKMLMRNETCSIENFIFAGKLKFSDPAQANTRVLLRNYYASWNRGERESLLLIKFQQGYISFADQGKTSEIEDGLSGEATIKTIPIPEDEFRFRIQKNGRVFSYYVNDEKIYDLTAAEDFNLTQPIQLQVMVTNHHVNPGEAHTVTMDDLMVSMEEGASEELMLDEPAFYVDFGNGNYVKEKVLDPFVSAKGTVKVGNPTNEPQTITALGGPAYNIKPYTLQPGEVKDLELIIENGYGEDFSKDSSISLFFWDSVIGMHPLIDKQSIKNEHGFVIDDIPTLKEKMKTLKPGQMWITDAQVENIKGYLDETSPTYDENFVKYWNDFIRTTNRSYLNKTPISYPTDGDVVQPCSNTYKRISALSLAYRILEDEQYAESALKEMLNLTTWSDWRSDVNWLALAAVTLGMAIGHDCMYDYLSEKPDDMAKIEQAMYEKGLTKMLEIHRTGNFSKDWPFLANNFNGINNSSTGILSLALGCTEKYRDEAAEGLNFALRRIQHSVMFHTKDGGWPEGSSYSGYMQLYMRDFFRMLNSGFGTTYGYEQIENYKNTYKHALALSGAKSYPLEDAPNVGLNTKETNGVSGSFYSAYLIDEPGLGRLHADYLTTNSEADYADILWYDPRYKDAEFSFDPEQYDRELGLLALRDNWENNTYFAFNAGSNNVDHAHLDMGSFVYDYSGVRWFEDLGIDNERLYDISYENGYKWYYYRNRAEGHNCMIFNPKDKYDGTLYSAPDQVQASVGTIKDSRINQNDYSYASMDITSAYKDDCSSYIRTMLLDKNTGGILIKDDMNLKKNDTEYYWFAHTTAAIELDADGKGATLTLNINDKDNPGQKKEKKLYVKIIEGEGTFEDMAAQPLSSSPNPDTLSQNQTLGLRQNTNANYRKLAIHQTGCAAGARSLVVAAIPYDKKDQINSLKNLLP